MHHPFSSFEAGFEILFIDCPTSHGSNGAHFFKDSITLAFQLLDCIHRGLLIVDIYLQYHGLQ